MVNLGLLEPNVVEKQEYIKEKVKDVLKIIKEAEKLGFKVKELRDFNKPILLEKNWDISKNQDVKVLGVKIK